MLKLLVHVSFHYFEWCGSVHYVTPEAICGCVFLTAAFDTVKRSSALCSCFYPNTGTKFSILGSYNILYCETEVYMSMCLII